MKQKTKKYKRPKAKHHYNWHPDLPDQRDLLFVRKAPSITQLPPAIDLRNQCSPIFNQGHIGSCTGNALAGAFEFLELKELKSNDPSHDPEVFGTKYDHVSRLFIYYNERFIEGTTGQDAGAQLRDGIKALNKFGVCRETTWKYAPTLVLKKPSTMAYSEASPHFISSYLKIDNLAEMRNCLAQGFPVAFGFTVYESFESPEVAQTGQMPLPQDGERVLGGHAVLAVGYNDSHQHLIVRNSWGTKWGLKGYFYMPYEIIEQKMAQDFWTIRK